MAIETFLLNYGYPAVFAGVLLIGETSVMAAGFLAHQGYLRLDLIIIVATVSAFLGDQTGFLIGRKVGLSYLERKPKWQPRLDHVRRLANRYGDALILGFRFLALVHDVVPPALGALKFNPRRFTLLNLFGAALWAAANAVAGYLFGLALSSFIQDLRRIELWVILGLIALGLTVGAIVSYRSRRMKINPPAKENQPKNGLERST